jgi:hypothetical protein
MPAQPGVRFVRPRPRPTDREDREDREDAAVAHEIALELGLDDDEIYTEREILRLMRGLKAHTLREFERIERKARRRRKQPRL